MTPLMVSRKKNTQLSFGFPLQYNELGFVFSFSFLLGLDPWIFARQVLF